MFPHSQKITISDLPIPKQGILLNRPNIMDEIDKRLSNKEGIQTVVLVGIRGSGKTTIARRYAKRLMIPMIWEINAETQESMRSSIKQLVYTLADSVEEVQKIDQIYRVQDITEHESRLITFLKDRMKSYSNWLIIFNNVKSFSKIAKYFPHDETLWGNGKVIITTRNDNIVHSDYILRKNIIRIGELDYQGRQTLFCNIVGDCADFSDKAKENLYKFLDQIPPFPLDISTAAHYIRETGISYDKYLQYMQNQEENFIFAQKNILQDIGEYTKTRYDIVVLSTKSLIDKSQNFADLLLFISLVNSENIPKDLLVKYENEITVDNFMRKQQKFSLIHKSDIENWGNSNTLFSIHRSIQNITLSYLLRNLHIKANSSQLNKMINTLVKDSENSIEEQDVIKVQLLIPHIESFLNHKDLLDRMGIARLEYSLSNCYFFMNNYKRSLELLLHAHEIYKEHYGESNIKTSELSLQLGIIYRNIGHYNVAREILEKVLSSYTKYYGKNSIEKARVLTYLGSVYRSIGNYSKAESLLEDSLETYVQHYGWNSVKTAWVLSYVGLVDKSIGNYNNAITSLEKALKLYQEHYGHDYHKNAWILVQLSNAYRNIGLTKKAKELIDSAIEIYDRYFGKDSIEYAWSLGHLGGLYKDIDDTKNATKTLAKSMGIYDNTVVEDKNLMIAWIKYHHGITYLKLKEYQEAELLLREAIDIYANPDNRHNVQIANCFNTLAIVYLQQGEVEKSIEYINKAFGLYGNHVDRHRAFESLGDLYLFQMKKEKDPTVKLQYEKQALENFRYALDIRRQNFPTNSDHIKRVESKLSKR